MLDYLWSSFYRCPHVPGKISKILFRISKPRGEKVGTEILQTTFFEQILLKKAELWKGRYAKKGLARSSSNFIHHRK